MWKKPPYLTKKNQEFIDEVFWSSGSVTRNCLGKISLREILNADAYGEELRQRLADLGQGMDIRNALTLAYKEKKAIRRKIWNEFDDDGLIIPTNSSLLGMFVISNDRNTSTPFWNPTADDLIADDWELC